MPKLSAARSGAKAAAVWECARRHHDRLSYLLSLLGERRGKWGFMRYGYHKINFGSEIGPSEKIWSKIIDPLNNKFSG